MSDEPIEVVDPGSLALARERARHEAAQLSWSRELGETVALITSELATNQLRHAGRGQIELRAIAREGIAGIEVIARDHGPGIADPRRALAGGYSSGGGLGQGVASCGRLADELDFDVRLGEGTAITARKFGAPVSRRREVGVIGRALPGERISGDDALFVDQGTLRIFAVADGLGHGAEAREASRRAVEAIAPDAPATPERLLHQVGEAITETRGVAMAIACVGEDGSFEHAAVGDVSGHLVRPRLQERFASTPGVLGPRPVTRITRATGQLDHRALLVLASDGLKSSLDVSEELALLSEHPIVIAQFLLAHFARAHDDALVLVAR